MEKKALILIILIGGILVLSEFAVATVTPTITLSSQKQLESQKSEKKENLQNPVIEIYVSELYGTPDNPQYKNLANVTVEIREGLFWMNLHWSGKTDERGRTEEVKVQLGFLYKVIVSKHNYLVYGGSPSRLVGINEIQKYHVNFTMVEEGSPFIQGIQEFSNPRAIHRTFSNYKIGLSHLLNFN